MALVSISFYEGISYIHPVFVLLGFFPAGHMRHPILLGSITLLPVHEAQLPSPVVTKYLSLGHEKHLVFKPLAFSPGPHWVHCV
jgi:hypothetical protein